MAWGRYYRYGYGRTYGRKRRSVKAITMSKSFKASASNMTQNGVFNISVRSSIDHKTPLSAAGNPAIKIDKFDVAQQIASSPMHQQLSNVFDEYKIEKVSIKISPAGHSEFTGSFDVNYIEFFACIDRTGFATIGIADTDLSIDKCRTYQSFKSINWPVNGDSTNKLYINIGQSDIVNKSKYYDSKGKAVIPELMTGVSLPNGGNETDWLFTVEIDAQVRYRGVRYDNRNVNAAN